MYYVRYIDVLRIRVRKCPNRFYTLHPFLHAQWPSSRMMRMPVRSTKRRVKQLWRKRRELDAKINGVIRRRLRRFRRGSISSEEFEKGTREERKFDRLVELINEIEEKTKPRTRYTKSILAFGAYPKT